jgi:hypothetical protein
VKLGAVLLKRRGPLVLTVTFVPAFPRAHSTVNPPGLIDGALPSIWQLTG